MVGADVSHLEMVDAMLEPGKGIAHFSDQVENLQVGGFVLGMIAGILLVRKIMLLQKLLDLLVGTLGIGFGVMLFQILDADIKVERLETLRFLACRYAALSRLV